MPQSMPPLCVFSCVGLVSFFSFCWSSSSSSPVSRRSSFFFRAAAAAINSEALSLVSSSWSSFGPCVVRLWESVSLIHFPHWLNTWIYIALQRVRKMWQSFPYPNFTQLYPTLFVPAVQAYVCCHPAWVYVRHACGSKWGASCGVCCGMCHVCCPGHTHRSLLGDYCCPLHETVQRSGTWMNYYITIIIKSAEKKHHTIITQNNGWYLCMYESRKKSVSVSKI